MSLKRRNFIGLGAIAASGGLLSSLNSCSSENQNESTAVPAAVKSMSADAVPISNAERLERVAKAQRLLTENKIGALILDCGTSMVYFTGVQWWPSERTMIAIIPAKGEVKYVCPAFEEARLREQITIGKEVYAWQEDESPYKLIVSALKDAGVASGDVGVEERTRFFIVDGIRRESPGVNIVSGDPVTIPCRIIKSPAEIKLMQTATDITLTAIKNSVAQLKEGMSQSVLASIIMKAQNDLGGSADFALCLFGKASAFPHGTREPQLLKKGDIVLMDCGCNVHGYNSDVTRTIVFGAEPTKRQEEIWNLEKQAQAAGFAAAKIGSTGDAVDAAARKVVTDAGFGPGYKLPGIPHRTGHGIGMDGHEWGNMVKGNMQPLEAGMCFSIEPTIAIVGEFGVRFEDCVYMTAEGPKWFSKPGKSIQEPFG
ncbi:Xaa-Pro peptidase family protein [Pollutibacter soli]|uniref:M24 family metallopeptidase n=1 Tax=Pollutibacter soli TaxID=3034157 RepID=UPI0030136C93